MGVYLNNNNVNNRIYSFPSFANSDQIDGTVTVIPLNPPREASSIIVKKDYADYTNSYQYILNFCELEAWGKLLQLNVDIILKINYYFI